MVSDSRSYDYFFIGFLMFFSIVEIKQASSVMTINDAKDYLSKFGYLTPNGPNTGHAGLPDINTWRVAVKDFQKFVGLNVTGQLDVQTRKLMSLPRCGVRDKGGFGTDSRSKRYALQGSRWRVNPLTYNISSFPKRLRHRDVKAEIARAFAVWSEHTDLTFIRKKSGIVHIDISFEEGEHGDNEVFDGRGGTLAHASNPDGEGDVHFDAAELWTIGSMVGINLFQVAAHEFGHLLGLSHSDVHTALMAPFYRGFVPNFKLDTDDVLGIQALYGKRTTGGSTGTGTGGGAVYPHTTQQPIVTTPRDEICREPKVDALFNSADGHTYAFKGNKYYKLTANAIADGYPKLILNRWPRLPDNIDAACECNGNTYLFKGTKYWVYRKGILLEFYPKLISVGFPGLPDNLDAAYSGGLKIYFFKGSNFWIYRFWVPQPRLTLPKQIFSQWKGLPNNLDAAMYKDGYMYFLKRDKYYRCKEDTFAIESADILYHRSLGDRWWFGCNAGAWNRTHTPIKSNVN